MLRGHRRHRGCGVPRPEGPAAVARAPEHLHHGVFPAVGPVEVAVDRGAGGVHCRRAVGVVELHVRRRDAVLLPEEVANDRLFEARERAVVDQHLANIPMVTVTEKPLVAVHRERGGVVVGRQGRAVAVSPLPRAGLLPVAQQVGRGHIGVRPLQPAVAADVAEVEVGVAVSVRVVTQETVGVVVRVGAVELVVPDRVGLGHEEQRQVVAGPSALQVAGPQAVGAVEMSGREAVENVRAERRSPGN